jgi:hypothetical protein
MFERMRLLNRMLCSRVGSYIVKHSVEKEIHQIIGRYINSFLVAFSPS